MWRLYALIVAVWLVLLPPLFTGGACTAQFDAEAARVQADIVRLGSSAAAAAYWSERAVPAGTLSVDQCRAAKPRYVQRCGSGPLVVARVPVEHPVCRYYRDDEIRVQLQYDERGRLARIATDMDPYKSLALPFTSLVLHWAR